MGWYTSGPGDHRFKSGDVAELTRACRLGEFSAVPRVGATDEDGDELELGDLEFFGPLQRRARELRLPWTKLALSGTGDGKLALARDADLDAVLRKIAGLLYKHAASVGKAIAKTVDGAPKIASLEARLELDWRLAEKDYPKLVAWLKKGSTGRGKLSLARIKAGELDGDDYVPPDDLASVVRGFDPPRSLAFHALAFALLEKAPLHLSQPDDVHRLAAWPDKLERRARPRAAKAKRVVGPVLLFDAQSDPFLRCIARVLGLPDRLRGWVYFIYHDGFGVDLTVPEYETIFADWANQFVDYAFEVLKSVSLDGIKAPKPGGFSVGCSALQTMDEVVATSRAQGLEAWSPGRLLEGYRRPFQGKTATERLRALAAREPGAAIAKVVQYVLDGKGRLTGPLLPSVGRILAALEEFSELSKDHLTRLTKVVKQGAGEL